MSQFNSSKSRYQPIMTRYQPIIIILYSDLNNRQNMQNESQQTLERLLKVSSLIESNCEYLTTIQRCITDDEVLNRDSLPTLEEYMKEKKCKMNQESLRQALIQVTYFIFSCRRFSVEPQITKDDIRVQEVTMKAINEKRFSLVIFYRITDQKQLIPFQSIAIIKDLYVFLLTVYAQYVEYFKTELTPMQMAFHQYIEKFKKQVDYLLTNPKLYENKQKQFFLCLEETLLFREYSSLLKIKNCSILDLIKTKQLNFIQFKQCKKKDVDLVIAYGNQKKKPKTDHDKIKEKEKEIQYNIVQLFKFLEKSQSIVQQTNQNQKNDKEQQDKMKIVYKHRQKPVHIFYDQVKKIITGLPQPPAEQPIQKRDQNPDMEYLIEYSSERNSICVRLIPNQINIHIENSDFLMYQSNILTFETVNVNIELVESVVDANFQKKTMKRLAFKGTSCLNSKEPPLEKILLLMDATMIASKICEPELNALKVAFSGLSDHERLNLVANKINHYTRIYLRCAKKVYSE